MILRYSMIVQHHRHIWGLILKYQPPHPAGYIHQRKHRLWNKLIQCHQQKLQGQKNPGNWAYKCLLEHWHKVRQRRNLIRVNSRHLHNLIRKGKSQSKIELVDHQHAMILPARKKKGASASAGLTFTPQGRPDHS